MSLGASRSAVVIVLLGPEVEGIAILRNVRKYSESAVSLPRRLQSSATLLGELGIPRSIVPFLPHNFVCGLP